MERTIDEGQGELAEPAETGNGHSDEDDRARLIGEIVEAFVLGLGRNQAMTAERVVKFAPRASSGRSKLSGLQRARGRNAPGIGGLASPDQRGASPANAEGSGVGVVCLIPPGHGLGCQPRALFELAAPEGERHLAVGCGFDRSRRVSIGEATATGISGDRYLRLADTVRQISVGNTLRQKCSQGV